MREFCGACAKSYYFTIEGESNGSVKCKGVKDSAACELTMDDYLNCVFNDIGKTVSFNTIRSTGHEVYTEKTTKIALRPMQDVR